MVPQGIRDALSRLSADPATVSTVSTAPGRGQHRAAAIRVDATCVSFGRAMTATTRVEKVKIQSRGSTDQKVGPADHAAMRQLFCSTVARFLI